MRKQVMVRAWEIAREGQAKFGGKVGEYIAFAMKMAWEEVKNETKMTMYDVAEVLKNKLGNKAKVNVWERYGKRRIYVNKGYREQIAVLEFDNDDNLISDFELNIWTVRAAIQHGVYDETMIVGEVVKEIA